MRLGHWRWPPGGLAKDTANAPPVDLTGRTIAHYRVLEKIGEGGMGEVFLADDTSLHRKVALKFLPPVMQQDLAAHKRFIGEARAAAALDHPYICHINEVAQFEGHDFIVMEYVDGGTLKDRLARGPLPLKEALQIADEVAEALEAAHGKGIIHRDIKPANIMMMKTGHAKVMDFGLAKLTHLQAAGADAATVLLDGGDTAAGAVLGTIGYMAPEQIRAQDVDQRTDIFAFGCVLYEMLSGQRAFQGATAADTMSAILTREPLPLSSAREHTSLRLLSGSSGGVLKRGLTIAFRPRGTSGLRCRRWWSQRRGRLPDGRRILGRTRGWQRSPRRTLSASSVVTRRSRRSGGRSRSEACWP